MPTVDATVGGAAANSYVAVADADAYFLSSFNRALWASSSDKEALVISASRYLDGYMAWEGEKTSPDQAMEWPRKNTFTKSGIAYADDVIPMPLKFAVYELAYFMLENNGLTFESSTVDQVKVGPISLKFNQSVKDLGLPHYVISLISHIGSSDLSDPGMIHTVRLTRT